MKKNISFASISSERGVTLIEILVAIGVAVILIGISTTIFYRLNNKFALDKGVDAVTSTLQEARSLTLAGKNGLQYGVHFGSSELVLFEGASYSSSDPNNVVTNLNFRAAIRNISLSGGGSDVVFKRLTGATDNVGSVEVYILNEASASSTVNILNTGVVQELEYN